MQETEKMDLPFLGQKDPLEEGMATYLSILAWERKNPWWAAVHGVTKSQTWLTKHTLALVVQWLSFHASTEEGTGPICVWELRSPILRGAAKRKTLKFLKRHLNWLEIWHIIQYVKTRAFI